MSRNPSPELQKFMEAHKVAKDEVWQVHGSAWVIKHKALERVAAEVGVVFDRPAMLETNSMDGIVAMVVFGKLGERQEWSVGEAAPKNNKNAYPYAMAEKRAKDRVILKLLNVAAYSEAEADEFEQRQNPHVTRAVDILPEASPDDRIGAGQAPTKKLTVAEQRPVFAMLQAEIHDTASVEELKSWKARADVRDRAAMLKDEWKKMLEGVYAEHKGALINQDRGDERRAPNMMMAG